jgi:uncharacterized protein (DUF697 family)
MPMTQVETVASLRILTAVAKADGLLTAEEKDLIECALEDAKLEGEVSLAGLLADEIDVGTECKKITQAESREAAYNAAYAMAVADGAASDSELKILDEIRVGLLIPNDRATVLGRVIGEAKDTLLPSHIKAISDPEKRAAEIREDTWKYSLLSAALGAFPVPGLGILADMAVVGLQIKLVRDIGQYHGHHVDKQAARSLLFSMGVGIGMRIALNNLVRFIPGWGSVVAGGTSFATTWGIGKVADQYFANDGKLEPAELKSLFKTAKKEGEKEASANKDKIEDARKASEAQLKELAEKRQRGEISEEEFQAGVDKLI